MTQETFTHSFYPEQPVSLSTFSLLQEVLCTDFQTLRPVANAALFRWPGVSLASLSL